MTNRAPHALAKSGSLLTIFDWDQDGRPEIVRSTEDDSALVVESFDGRMLRARRSIATPSGVVALGSCPPEEGAKPALVAAVGDHEVWIVR